jgi:alginate O-acetyltransferase complex protein AlgI
MIYTDVLFIVLLLLAWLITEFVRPWPAFREWLIISFSFVVVASWGLFSLGLLLAVAALNFAAIRLAATLLDSRLRTAVLGAAVLVDLAALAAFKYAAFLKVNLQFLFDLTPFVPTIGIPLAISFYTFHLISYVVDFGQGRSRVMALRPYLFYLSFFPHVVAGPIVRTWQLVPQVGRNRRLKNDLAFAFHYFVVGFFLKSIVANNIAERIDPIWISSARGASAADLWFTAVLYYCQIYADFAGYTLMALGMARLFGYRLPVNFRTPLLAISLQDFWRRWHITLSRWLRDYLYIPLGGNRRGYLRGLLNVIVTFLLGGLWHGAAWNFVIWGAMHGVGLAGERVLHAALPRARFAKSFGWLTTQVWVTLAWVFFRSSSLDGAVHFVSGMFRFNSLDAFVIHGSIVLPVLVASGAIVHQLTPFWLRRARRPALARHLGIITGLLFVIDVIVVSPSKVFIYFVF